MKLQRNYGRCCLRLIVSCGMVVAARAQQPPGPIPTPPSLRHPAPAPSAGRPFIQGPVHSASPSVDFGLTATPTSPIAVYLSWKTVPGAAGYTILRDGVSLADTPVNARFYSDNTVKPQTSYRYQLRADGLNLMVNGVRTALPLDSAAVQVMPPLPLSPPGFTAMLAADNSVQLSWTGRPEASAYLIVKGSQTFRVAAGVQNSFVDTNPGNGDVQYTIATIVRASDGSESNGYHSPPLSIRVRPFNVVVVGDSIMWGQGLADANKFSTLVISWLRTGLGGRQVLPFNRAHSGAIVGDDPDDRDRPSNVTMIGGEVPEGYPSVLNQAMLVRTELDQRQILLTDVDLILMDGCANDITLGKVLAPWTNDSEISSLGVTYCFQQMTSNLKTIHGVYPNAKIIVTGYYPIVSSKSDPLAVTTLTTVLLGPAGLAGGIIAWDQAIDHSRVFFGTTSSMLMSAVLTANSQIGASLIRFVVPAFDDTNSYAAPATFVWLVPSPPTLPNQFDEVYLPRQSVCASMGTKMPLTCPPASMGHPNAFGARAYANAITGALGEFLPQWKLQFALVQRAP